LPNVRASGSYQREQLGAKGFLESAGVYNKVDNWAHRIHRSTLLRPARVLRWKTAPTTCSTN
jgi:hypothetical protein